MKTERKSSTLSSLLVPYLSVVVLSLPAGAATPSLAEPDDLTFDEASVTASAPPRVIKEQMLERRKSLRAAAPAAAAKAAKPKVVDCAKGDSLQKAIDNSADGDTIEVRGLCNENVKIVRRKLTLHGLDPLTDGVRGVASTSTVYAALEIWYSELIHIENLSFTHTGAGAGGLGLWYSTVEAVNCRMTGNAQMGAHVSASSYLDASGLILSDNGGHGLNVQRNSFSICLGCRLENNALRAAAANRASFFSLWDSVITGARGLLVTNDSYGDLDCITGGSGLPCSLNVTQIAATGLSNGTAGLYGAGPFAGQVTAFDRGQVSLYGAQQTSTGVTPSGNPRVNSLDYFSTL
ncbi:MAG TPA: right-handed parallel beta-helix repeat-containing protein, partial [Thermoanaerobaculia bacterium]